MTPKEPNGSDSLNRRDVEAALRNVLASEQFSGSARLSSFLSYIVTKKLDGREEDIKAYSIAVDALGRGEDFDPQENAFVRVTAGRLRQVLTLYYASDAGTGDTVRIDLEPGSYVPKFVPGADIPTETADVIPVDTTLLTGQAEETINVSTTPAVAAGQSATQAVAHTSIFASKWWRLAIAFIGFAVITNLGIAIYMLLEPSGVKTADNGVVLEKLAPVDIGIRPRIKAYLELPDASYPVWFKPDELADSMGVIMARFDDYQFLGVEKIQSLESKDMDSAVDYALSLTAHRRDESLRVFARLTNTKSETIIWSVERFLDRPDTMSGRNVPDIIGRAYSPVASPYGVLYANISNAPDQRSELACVIKGYRYFYAKTSAKHGEARECAEKMVEGGTRLPSIYAMLTFLYLDEFRENRNPRVRDPVAAANKAAKTAVALGPQSARAHQALFATHKVHGHRDMARAAAEKALILNPYDTDIIGDYAAWLISIGDVKKGREYLTRVEGMLDARPAWLDFYRFLGAELSRDFKSAKDISMMMDMKRAPLIAVAVAIGAHARADTENTRLALKELIRAEPAFLIDPTAQFINRGFDEKVARQLVEKLNVAGLKRIAAQ